MENQTTQTQQNLGGQMPLPNATGILVLGIVSIALCWCYGIIGIACGIIALVMAGKAKATYLASPDTFTVSSYNNMKAGRICALIGTILSSLYIVFIIVYILIVGAALTTLPWNQF
jgi:hypothetical protein